MFFDTNSSIQLDPEVYRSNPDAYRLAVALSEEVEIARAAIRATEKPGPGGLLGGSEAYESDSRAWHVFATDMSIAHKAALRLAMPLHALVEGISTLLMPPNWEIFFWMGAYLKASGEVALQHIAKQAEEIQRRNERKKQLSAAGAKGGAAKNEGTQKLKAWALAEAANMKGAQRDLSRRLAGQIPENMRHVSQDPERLIYDALRSERAGSNTAG